MSHSMIRIKTKGVYIIYPCCYICLGGKAAGWQQSTGSANQIEGGCSSWGWENCSATRHLDLGGGSKWELHSGECLHVSLTWCIWYHGNRIVFSNESFNGKKLMDDALFFCRTWLKNMEEGFDIPFHSWSSNIRAEFCVQGGIRLYIFVVGILV